MSGSIVSDELRRTIISTFPMGKDSIHGPAHWDRVVENAMRIREETEADVRILELFALFHDSLRRNDAVDPGHGVRGAKYAGKLREEGLFELEEETFQILYKACAEHTDGTECDDSNIITCWDADRLDLWRCGIIPESERMCTSTARRQDVIDWAMQRSGGPPDGKILIIGKDQGKKPGQQ